MNDESTFSVPVSLQRITKETVKILVPVKSDLAVQNEDGTSSLSGEKIFSKALELGAEVEKWERESVEIIVSPIQTP